LLFVAELLIMLIKINAKTFSKITRNKF